MTTEPNTYTTALRSNGVTYAKEYDVDPESLAETLRMFANTLDHGTPLLEDGESFLIERTK